MKNYNTKYVGNRRFVLLSELAYPVKLDRSGTVVFPAGTKNVWCSFRTSHLVRTDPETHRVERLNVYMKNNTVVHG